MTVNVSKTAVRYVLVAVIAALVAGFAVSYVNLRAQVHNQRGYYSHSSYSKSHYNHKSYSKHYSN